MLLLDVDQEVNWWRSVLRKMNRIDVDNVRSGRNAVLETQLVRNARRGGMCKEEECDKSRSSESVVTGSWSCLCKHWLAPWWAIFLIGLVCYGCQTGKNLVVSLWAKALCLFEFSFSMSSGNVCQSSHYSHFLPMQTLNIILPGVYHSCFGNEDST